MSNRPTVCRALIGLLIFSSSLALAATPVRKTSRNGDDSTALSWNLFGPTLAALTDGGDFTVVTQVVCPEQTVGAFVSPLRLNDPHDSGSCLPFDPTIDTTSRYLFLFQVQTTRKNFKATISNLVGFVPDTGDPNYGVELCDANNTFELCSPLSDADATSLNETSTVSPNNKKISFVVRKLPVIFPGLSVNQQGLTFFVLTAQPVNVPIAVPKFTIQ